ncbi:MAG: hypothetical protein U0414_42205 [Polyangiaceae bacterium]
MTAATIDRFEVDHLVESLDDYRRYRAWDPASGKHVSLLLVADRKRFARIREATARVTALDHHRFTRFVAAGDAPGGAGFLAFEWIEGTTLLALLRDGPLGIREAEDIAFGLAEALGAVHDAGFSHGAVGPKNVLTSRRSRPASSSWASARPRPTTPRGTRSRSRAS